jgi:hypothetical protein
VFVFLGALIWLLPIGFATAVAPMPATDLAEKIYPDIAHYSPRETVPRKLQFVLNRLKQSHDSSTPVRILFYGQSITEQGWWKRVVENLRHSYPHAVLQIENRALGGHSAELLVKTAEADLYLSSQTW